MSVTYTVGDTRDVTATIPDGSVSLVACSPPFIALRSYLPADHPDKHREIGSEPDPATFLDTLLALTAEWGRVLAPWGSIAIELGDTYSGSGGAGGDYNEGGLREGQGMADGSGRRQRAADVAAGILAPTKRPGPNDRDRIPGWPMAKSLALVPQLYAASLAYGRNLLRTGVTAAEFLDVLDEWVATCGPIDNAALAYLRRELVARDASRLERFDPWRIRNMIVWHRPNPAVGALGDKYRPSTSYIVVATRSVSRWFDLTAVRGEPSPNSHARTAKGVESRPTTGKTADKDGNFHTLDTLHSTAGAPPLDCWFDEWDGSHDTWTQTTQPSSLAHYAMWPAKLAERLILSMCPAEVCTFCREPRRRIETTTNAIGEATGRRSWRAGTEGIGAGHVGDITRSSSSAPTAERETTGWTDCGCGVPFTPGTVLDPFAGTGTTLAVADLHGRDAIGIDIDVRNHDLYPARRAEVARNLFGSPIPDPNQLDLFGATA